MMRDYYKDGMIFRLGGDEFLIITIGMDQEMFLRISSEFRCALEEEKLAALGYNFYEKPENIWACIDQCDALMYKEKNRMKN
jgi:GGDEF domain-containing protein